MRASCVATCARSHHPPHQRKYRSNFTRLAPCYVLLATPPWHILLTVSRAILAFAPLLLSGCNLIITSYAPQCDTDDQCVAYSAAEFVDTVCNQATKTCVPREESSNDCTTNAACTEDIGAPAICRNGDCVELTSEDCTQVIGDFENDNAVVYGIFTPLTGPSKLAGTTQTVFHEMAIDEINEVGLPGGTAGVRRPLVGVNCDIFENPVRAATHLVEDLGVPAINGFTTTEETTPVATVAAPAGVMTLCTFCGQEEFQSLQTDFPGLIWSMVSPSDTGRKAKAKVLLQLETNIRTALAIPDAPTGQVKIIQIVATGQEADADRFAEVVTINGEPLLLNDAAAFKTFGYTEGEDISLQVAEIADFAPHIIIGSYEGGDGVDDWLVQVEQFWTEPTYRPEWLFANNVFEAGDIEVTIGESGARARVRGTDSQYNYDSTEYAAFKNRYKNKTGNDTFQGIDEYYEEHYVLAYAMSGIGATLSGSAIADAFAHLDGGGQEFFVGPSDATTGFGQVASGADIDLEGVCGDYDFDLSHYRVNRKDLVWCIIEEDGMFFTSYTSAGLYNPETDTLEGVVTCP